MSDIFLSRRILKKKLAYVFSTWDVMPPIRKGINEVIEKSVVGDVVRVGREPSGFTDMRGKTICNGDIVMCHNNPKDICKVVLGEFDVIELETFEAVENVVGWHTEVIPTADPLSKLEPFNLTMPLNKFYLERSEMIVIGNIYDNPELLMNGGGTNGADH
jgi:hypothetical protein|nr:MAG TPA: YopX protein [Caudoviricetes sp.]